jgi:hypothetical protein
MSTVILLQGPNTHPNEIKQTYKGLPVIFSTLNDSETESLSDSGFVIVKNKIPEYSGRSNFNYQVTNTYEGIKKAQELGYKFVLKIRSDITIPEIQKLISIIGKPKNTILFSAYHQWDGGYLCEHMVFGKIDIMKKLWNIPLSYSNLPPETQLTNHFFKVLPKTNVDYIFPILYENNIKAKWEKRNFYLNEYKSDNLFIYDKFKK